MTVNSDFSVVTWDTSPDPSIGWPARVQRAVRVLLDRTSVETLLDYDDDLQPHEVDEHSLAELIADSEGVLTLIGTGSGKDRVEEWFVRMAFVVGDPLIGSATSAHIELPSSMKSSEAPDIFHELLAVWNASWGCVESRQNVEQIQSEVPQGSSLSLHLDRMLHWRTWFGAERAQRLPVKLLAGRPGVGVRWVQGGVEISLDDQWPGEDVLRQRQRELEPLLFDAGADRASRQGGLWRRLRGG